MAVINVVNFAGEIPRMPARALPPGAAQVNQNLLATATEFRPMQDHAAVMTGAAAAARTLWRGTKNTSGALITDDTSRWASFPEDFSFVKAQLNDDSTDRSYVTRDDGTVPPMAFDVATNRRLGVPAPAKPLVTLNPGAQFTLEQANAWVTATLNPALKKVVMDSLELSQDKARFIAQTHPLSDACVSVAGATSIDPIYLAPQGLAASVRGVVEPWNVLLGIPLSVLSTNKLDDPVLGGKTALDPRGSGMSFHYLPLNILPFWARVTDQAAMETRLRDIDSPRSGGGKLFTTLQATNAATKLAALFATDAADLKSKRADLDKAYQDFGSAVAKSMAASTPTPPGAEPDKNNRTAYPLPFDFIVGHSTGGESETWTPDFKTTSYQAWEADHTAWQTRKDTYDAAIAAAKLAAASGIEAIRAAQVACEDASHAIDQLFMDRMANLDDLISGVLDNLGLVQTESNTSGLVVVDPDRIVDPRFYFVTWVSDWNEESAPSPVTDMLEVDQNDSVTIMRPALPPYGNVVKWCIYRSNVGNSGTDFRLVKELPIAQTIRASITDLAGVYNWKDDADWEKTASLMILNDQNGQQYIWPTDNNHLQPGDTVLIKKVDNSATRQRSWTGQSWGNAVSPSGVGGHGYVDGLPSTSLIGECLSLTWAEPPYRLNTSTTPMTPKGADPYLRGLTGGSNGVMAGFIDNFVAFCEPNHGYAWPVKYQVPLEYPVVGLGYFGQTWFVGTMGKPYLISGADPSSYTPQKLDTAQSCVSRKSIISYGGGVFYASPDGYCFCTIGGVEIVTIGLFSREDWQKLNPSSIFAVMHDNVLYFWYAGNGGGCYALDTVAKKLVRHDFLVTAVFDDVVTDATYGVKDGTIYKLFSAGRHTGRWQSGQMVMPMHAALAWLQVWGDQSPDAPATVKWYWDGVLAYTVDVTDNNPVRLPPGRYREHTIEIVSKARITQLSMASSTAELQQL